MANYNWVIVDGVLQWNGSVSTSGNATVGGNLTVAGQGLFADGTAAAPGAAFASNTAKGLYSTDTNGMAYAIGGLPTFRLDGSSVQVGSNIALAWVNTTNAFTGTADTILVRDAAANTLALKNGTNAQTLRLYNTTTGSEYAKLTWNDSTNVFDIGTVGAARSIRFKVNNTAAWMVDGSTGHWLAVTDNTYDIGASGATRPRNIYLGGSIVTAAAGAFQFDTRGNITATADGVFKLLNNANTGFTRLILGTNDATNSGASLALTAGGTLEVKRGDASAYAAMKVLGVTLTGTLDWASASQILGTTDGNILLRNAAGSSFGLLQLGGTTSSFPALKRNGTTIQFRLADDSSSASLSASDASLISLSIVGNMLIRNTAPTISSGFGTSPSISANNGTAAFTITVGTGGTASTGVIGLPAATTGWIVMADDGTTPGINATKQTASSTTSATLTNYNTTTGVAAAWAAGDVIRCIAMAY